MAASDKGKLPGYGATLLALGLLTLAFPASAEPSAGPDHPDGNWAWVRFETNATEFRIWALTELPRSLHITSVRLYDVDLNPLATAALIRGDVDPTLVAEVRHTEAPGVEFRMEPRKAGDSASGASVDAQLRDDEVPREFLALFFSTEGKTSWSYGVDGDVAILARSEGTGAFAVGSTSFEDGAHVEVNVGVGARVMSGTQYTWTAERMPLISADLLHVSRSLEPLTEFTLTTPSGESHSCDFVCEWGSPDPAQALPSGTFTLELDTVDAGIAPYFMLVDVDPPP